MKFMQNMDCNMVVLALPLLLSMLVLQGDAIKCYECNSAEDSQCAYDIPPESMQRDCSSINDGNFYTFCRKIVQSIDFSVNNLPPETRVIRSCGYDDSEFMDECYKRSGVGGRQEVCACSFDNCNGASSVQVTVGLMLATLLALLVRT